MHGKDEELRKLYLPLRSSPHMPYLNSTKQACIKAERMLAMFRELQYVKHVERLFPPVVTQSVRGSSGGVPDIQAFA